MTEPFYLLFGVDDLNAVPLNYFIGFRKYCSSHDDLSAFIERVDQAALNRFSVQLLESVIKLLDDFDGYHFDDITFRRSKVLIHIFMHLAGKSTRFCEASICHSVGHWTMLMRFDFIRTEALMSLTFICRHLYRATLADDTFTHMLSDLATWWNQVSLQAEQRNCITDCFKALLEHEYLFLQQCHSTIDKDSFLDILFLAESLMAESPNHPGRKRARFDPSNVRFCVDYFEQLDREFADIPLEFLFRAQANHVGLSLEQVPTDIGMRMFLLTAIISAAALRRPDYDDSLHDEQRAVHLICGLLKVLLEVEEIRRREVEAQKANMSRQRSQPSLLDAASRNKQKQCAIMEKVKECEVKASEAPEVELVAVSSEGDISEAKSPHDEMNTPCTSAVSPMEVNVMTTTTAASATTAPYGSDTKTVSSANDNVYLRSSNQLRLVLLKRQIVPHVAAGLRETCVRAIGNLCTRSMANQLTAGVQLNAIPMLLRCAMKVDLEKPLIPQKAAHALTMLCAGCTENQERLLAALDLTGNVVDRIQLLATLGFKAEIEEETGKILRLSALPPGAKLPSPPSPGAGSSNGAVEEDDEDDDDDDTHGNRCEDDEDEDDDDDEEDEDDDGEEEGEDESVASESVPELSDEQRPNDAKRKRQKSAEPSDSSKRSKSADGYNNESGDMISSHHRRKSPGEKGFDSDDDESLSVASTNEHACPLNAAGLPLS